MYWFVPASGLPSFFPGFKADSAHIAVKHAIGSLIIALVLHLHQSQGHRYEFAPLRERDRSPIIQIALRNLMAEKRDLIDRAAVLLWLSWRERCASSFVALWAVPCLWVLVADGLHMPVPIWPTTLLVLAIWWMVLMRLRLVFWRRIRARSRQRGPRPRGYAR
jgi:hypothetical protein